MKKVSIFTLFLIIGCQLASAKPQDNLQQKLQAALDKAAITNKVTGMQMTVIQGNKKTSVETGVMNKNGQKISQKNLFQIGSCTKSFTAAIILKLQEQGKLKTSDLVGTYLPEFKKYQNVTISQLLHNNSGIYNYTEDKAFQEMLFKNPKKQWTPKELIHIAMKHDNNFAPGKGWHYCNTNFVLAGMIAEKVTGHSMAALYKGLLFKKPSLMLKNTYYYPTNYQPPINSKIVHGFNDEGQDITNINMSWASTAGAIISNSEDLAHWTHQLFHNKVLNKKSMDEMTAMVSVKTGASIKANSPEGYGMAIGKRKDPAHGIWWGHQGETLGYHAIFVWYPATDLTIAVTANGEAHKLLEFATSIPAVCNK